ncbi:MAG TPA: DUF5313 family protein [Jatrophihabitans sp.]|nr:DUF5313 family protein [Jatrophihabitans sp.]
MHEQLGRERRRPSAWQWLKYLFGAGLPPELHAWVLHDTTCRTWALRQAGRTVLMLSPLILAVLLVPPGPFWIRGMAAFGGVIMSLIYSIGYAVEAAENRLVKAGYPAGTGERLRAERAERVGAEATARRRQKMFERIERRGR